MDKTPLVDRDIEAGRQLVQALDRTGFPLTAALWNYLPDEGAWRLLLASPKVSDIGPRSVYAAIQDVLASLHIDLALHHISAVGPEEHLVTELRLFAGTEPAPFIGGTHLYGTVIGDAYVESAYVYRAERIIGKSGVFEMWSAVPDRARKLWIARRCKISVEEGFFKKIEGEGLDLPQKQTRHGISAHVPLLTNIEKRGKAVYGDVMRWTILQGRLRSSDITARGVKVEGYHETSTVPTT